MEDRASTSYTHIHKEDININAIKAACKNMEILTNKLHG